MDIQRLMLPQFAIQTGVNTVNIFLLDILVTDLNRIIESGNAVGKIYGKQREKLSNIFQDSIAPTDWGQSGLDFEINSAKEFSRKGHVKDVVYSTVGSPRQILYGYFLNQDAGLIGESAFLNKKTHEERLNYFAKKKTSSLKGRTCKKMWSQD